VYLWENLFVITVKSAFGYVCEGCPWERETGSLRSLCSSLLIRSVNLIKWFTLTSRRHESEAIHLESQLHEIIILVVGRSGLNAVPVKRAASALCSKRSLGSLLQDTFILLLHVCHWIKYRNSFTARIGNPGFLSSRQLF